MNIGLRSALFCLVASIINLPAPTAVAEEESNTKAEAELLEESKSVELSVAPLDQIIFPSDRPQWLDNVPQLDDSVHNWVVVSSPSDTFEASEQNLRLMQRAAVLTYIQRLVNAGRNFDFFTITNEWIDEKLVRKSYHGEVTQGDTVLFEHATELEFDEPTRQEIHRAWKQVQISDRLGIMGLTVGGGFCLLVLASAVTGMLSRRVKTKHKVATS
ncbi:hypothetical protein CA13_14420 [Planctomycetes bacterium CA13]|uniref:Uncharacterized protein n=1 Tax=Novipirellula herctigrandis TaxID=2527986 RepID=A0A5C5YYM6_9BACT|nr:hypothetical protein CA13_14420 [Planctomycetes bacterium CA13]